MDDARSWRTVALRWLSLCGIIVPPMDTLVNVIVAAQQSHYDFLHDYISDLAAVGRPYSEALCALWAMFPLLFGPFAIAVHAALRRDRYGRALAILLAVFALCIGLCGVFRYDPVNPTYTLHSRMHMLVSTLAAATLFPCPVFFWRATRHDASWQRFRRFSLLVQGAGTVAGLVLGLASFHVIPWGGFAERIYWGIYYVWVGALAINLRRLKGTREHPGDLLEQARPVHADARAEQQLRRRYAE